MIKQSSLPFSAIGKLCYKCDNIWAFTYTGRSCFTPG